MKNERENNEVILSGMVVSDVKVIYEIYGKKFYVFDLLIRRLSENVDTIPIVVSDEKATQIKEGRYVHVKGKYRSYNVQREDCRSKLVLTVYGKEIGFIEETERDINAIFLNGFICKPVVYRITPFGRKIADILLAVNRMYDKTDYIPCIAWGNEAESASLLNVGEQVKVSGRIQSRQYMKKIDENQEEIRTAYEVSAFNVVKVE